MEYISGADEAWVKNVYQQNREEFCEGEKARIEQSRCTLEEFKEKFQEMLSRRVYPLLEPRFEKYTEELDFNPAESVIEYMWDTELEEVLLFYLRIKQWQLTASEKADEDMRRVERCDRADRKQMWSGSMVMLRGGIPAELRHLILNYFVEIDSWAAYEYQC